MSRHFVIFGMAALLGGVGSTVSAQTQYEVSEVVTELDCEAAFGMVSSIDGVNTCTLPVINELNFETDEGVANCNSGNAVSNGTFCRVPLEETNADNAPDCAAVNYAKASSAEALAEWQTQLDQPYSDAWKCARLE